MSNVNLVDSLSEAERKVYDLLFTGATNDSLAATLCISKATVKFHLANIYNKLGVSNRAGAIAYGLQGGGDLPSVGDKGKRDKAVGPVFTADELKSAASKLVALGIADRKAANALVNDLIAVLKGEIA